MSDRDIEVDSPQVATSGGRNVIATIGIDRYRDRHWRSLHNAVNDAQGVRGVFQRLGFEQFGPPLLDDRATGEAIRSLASDELRSLSPDDNLVVFFAGHGGRAKHSVGALQATTGYLIPCDGKRERPSSWIDIDAWLRQIAKQPPRHILVILDSCYSGVALSSVKWGRDDGQLASLPFGEQSARHSRLVIASALDNETALDGGVAAPHSLFTSCLLEALTGGIRPVAVRDGRGYTTGTELAHYVQRRVQSYPGAPGRAQSPDYGALEFDQRGEMQIPLLGAVSPSAAASDVAVPMAMAETASAMVDTAPAPRVQASEPASAVRSRPPAVIGACVLLVAGTGATYVAIDRVVAPRVAKRAARAVVPEPSTAAAAGSADAASVPSHGDAPAVVQDAPRKPAVPPRGGARTAAPGASKVAGPRNGAATVSPARSRGILAIPEDARPDEPRTIAPSSAANQGAGRARRNTAVTACLAPGARGLSDSADPATCFVHLRSTPVGADILRGNDVVGRAPCLLALPCSAATELTFRKSQYFDAEKTVRATAEVPTVVAKLGRAEHSMHVTSTPNGATVVVNGKRYGVTPIAVNFPAYQRSKLVVSKEGYVPETREVDALPKHTIPVVLKPVSGR